MSQKMILSFAAVLFIAFIGLAGYGVQNSFAAEENSEMSFHQRVAQILGIEETKLEDAMKQAQEEGYRHAKGFGMKMSMPSIISSCTDVELEELKAKLQESEGMTMAEVLTQLGVEDLQQVTECVISEREALLMERVSEGYLTQEEAEQRVAEMKERLDDMLQHEVGSGPHGEGMGKGMRRGMGNRMMDEVEAL